MAAPTANLVWGPVERLRSALSQCAAFQELACPRAVAVIESCEGYVDPPVPDVRGAYQRGLPYEDPALGEGFQPTFSAEIDGQTWWLWYGTPAAAEGTAGWVLSREMGGGTGDDQPWWFAGGEPDLGSGELYLEHWGTAAGDDLIPYWPAATAYDLVAAGGDLAPQAAGRYLPAGRMNGQTCYARAGGAGSTGVPPVHWHLWHNGGEIWDGWIISEALTSPAQEEPHWLGPGEGGPAGEYDPAGEGSGTAGALLASEVSAAARAAEHIYCPALAREDVQAARPFALLGGNDRLRARRANMGAAGSGGELAMAVEAAVPAALREDTTAAFAAAERWFSEVLGDILADLLAVCADGSILDLRGYELPAPIERTDPAEVQDIGDRYVTLVTIQWGIS